VNVRDRCKARSTLKREIENYLHKDAIVAAYAEVGISVSLTSNFDDFDDVPREIAQLVHESSESPNSWDELTEDQKSEKEAKAKRRLCSRAASHMTRELLDEMDGDGDLLEWFRDMKGLLVE
jgi:hypothetical protein